VKRPAITSRTNIGWYYMYVPGVCPRQVERPDVIATPGQLDGCVSYYKALYGMGRYGVEYKSQLYRKLGGKWVRLTLREAVALTER
jgi:hypothetical protein